MKAIALVLVLAACAATPAPAPAPDASAPPTAEAIVPTDSEISAEAGAAPEVAPRKSKLFGFLRGKTPDPTPPEPEPAVALAEAPVMDAAAVEPKEAAPKKSGLFGLLRRDPPDPPPPETVDVAAPALTETPATQTPEPEAEVAPAPQKRGLGALFGGKKRKAAADPTPDAGRVNAPQSTVAPDQVLPFGTVGVACGLPRSALGKEVDKFPKTGRAVWRLYDTAPDQITPRTQFITGFKDGCARQVTAALGLFGTAALHETLRYEDTNKTAYSVTDTAYESLKKRLCGVGKGKPCPAAKAKSMEKNTGFVTLYPVFGSARVWQTLLLSDGQLVAQTTPE